jgi:pimeloyl-ACP methyl ester carboxylesterase/DNA-binding SARP family transcriptional activator/class 3 adenylate cyclase
MRLFMKSTGPRIVTFLFTDIDLTGKSFRLNDEENRLLWRTHSQITRDAATRDRGQSVRNLGDGFLITFKNVSDALACAGRIQREAQRHNRHHEAQSRLHPRVALHIGEPGQAAHAYFETPVVISKRLCQSAQGAQVLVSGSVRRIAGSYGGYPFRDTGSFHVAGFAEPFASYEFIWKMTPEYSAVRLPLPPIIEGFSRSSIVGRREALEQMQHPWARARAGKCQFVLVTGQPGIGKTHFAAEFALSAHAEAAVVLFGSATKEAPSPYHPFVEALRHYVAHCPPETLEQQVQAYQAELAELLPELRRAVPTTVREKPSFPVSDAVISLFAAASLEPSFVLVLDDLHLADEQTLMLLKHIVRSKANLYLLIIGICQDSELGRGHPLAQMIADLQPECDIHRIFLDGLKQEHLGDFIRGSLGGESPRELIYALSEVTEGNPLFIKEVLRNLLESGKIYEEDGKLCFNLALEQISIPGNIKGLVDRRLTRVSESCMSIMAVASVIGRNFDLTALERSTGLSRDQLLERLEEAVAIGMLREDPVTAGRYVFSHNLIHEALLDKLSLSRRTQIHSQTLLYADNNRVKLAFEVLGGAGPFVIASGFANSAALRSRNRAQDRRWSRLTRFCRLILYDRRGTGFSDAPEKGYSVLAAVEDMRAILDAAGVEQVILLGTSDGGPLAITFADRHPERVLGLILADTTPKLINTEDFNLGINPSIIENFIRANPSDRGRAISFFTKRQIPESGHGSIELLKEVPRHAWSKITASFGAADVLSLLHNIKVPTLIIHDPQNSFIPAEAAHYLHEHISGSQLLITEEYGPDHIGESLYQAVGAFIEKLAAGELSPADEVNYHFRRTGDAIRRGGMNESLIHADIILNAHTEDGSLVPLALSHAARAFAMHELGMQEGIAEHIEKALYFARQIDNPETEFNVLWTHALLLLDNEDDPTAFEYLRNCFALGREYQFFNMFIDQPARLAQACVRALEENIETEYVQDMIRKRSVIPEKPPIHVEHWPWALKIYTLGQFKIFKEGEALALARKGKQKPLSMLKALIALGGEQGISEDQIADALWPDAEGDMAHRSFATTLHRLRKVIDFPEAIQLREGRLSLNRKYCWVDIWAFEHFLDRAEELWVKLDMKPKAVQFVRKALAFYHGPFLREQIVEFWTMSMRERLRSKFLRGVRNLGLLCEKNKEWAQAIEEYKRGLEEDHLAEQLYQHLMLCHQKLGQKAEALAVYDRCKKALSSGLGVEPSFETETIRNSLLSTKKI